MSSPSSPSESSAAKRASDNTPPPSLDDQLDRLTTAIQQVGDNIETCKTLSDERHALKLARAEEETKRTLSVQEQLAQMLAMTHEGLRREREEPVSVPAARTFAQDLQRAAFGTGGSAETASRSSMLESRQSLRSVESANGSAE